VAVKELEHEQFETQNPVVSYLPDLCTPTSVLSLVLVGELLALALCVVKLDLPNFDWAQFGLISFLIQWVMLTSAATLCAASQKINRVPLSYAIGFSYLVVLVYTIVFSVLGYWLFLGMESLSVYVVFSNTLVAAIFAGILLRYLYVQARLTHKEKSEADARLIALQSRIRPHFLFNSLNSIASLVDIDPVRAEKTVIDLSKLFRASLSLPRLIPIEREIELCRSFVDIEKLRLGERLQLESLGRTASRHAGFEFVDTTAY
jgi:two-component system sensor histidine kinase AlgZ